MAAISGRNILSAVLVSSVIVSAYILAVDNYLWDANPINHHAFGLIAFMAVDVALLIMLFVRQKMATMLAIGWGALQILLVVGDVAGGLGLPGFSSSDAYKYLILGNGNPSGLATDVLLVLNALIVVVSLPTYLKLRKETAAPAVAT